MRTSTKNMKKIIPFVAVALSVAAAPLQARGAPTQPFRLYQIVNGQPAGAPLVPGSDPNYVYVSDAGMKRAGRISEAGDALLTDGQYAAAEAKFREALALDPNDPIPYASLAEALDAQGQPQQALQAYRTLFENRVLSSTSDETRTQMGYAIVLSEVGRWPEAVAIYEKALPESAGYFGPRVDVHFDPHVPMPAQLQALAHVASGAQYSGSCQYKRAFVQYYQALRLDPDSAFANYYYGYGWGLLDPKDKSRVLNAQQAKAALQKAARIGKGDVKKAAQKALMVAMKPK